MRSSPQARRAEAEHKDVIGLDPAGHFERQHLDAVGARQLRLLTLAQAVLGDGRDRAGELTRRGLRRAGDVCRRELAEARQRAQALDHIGLGGEQLLAAQAQTLDQAVHVQVRTHRVDVRRACPVELEEHADALARLRRNLR